MLNEITGSGKPITAVSLSNLSSVQVLVNPVLTPVFTTSFLLLPAAKNVDVAATATELKLIVFPF